MPERRRNDGNGNDGATAPVRPIWSGTITFGLVSIPVDLFSAVRPRETSMKLVDKAGHPLGRRYHCSKDGRKLTAEEIVRGYPTDAGEMVTITDEEFESVAPEMSRDIELRRFVPIEQIPSVYYDRPYLLAPAGRSVTAYNLLAKTMERTDRVAIGTFVMRGHEYLVAILADNGVMRAETLRHADEIRTPEAVGLPRRAKPASKKIAQFSKEIESLTRKALDMAELEDRQAEALQQLVQSKQKRGEDVIERADLQAEEEGEGAQIIDFMEVLRKSLSKKAVVSTAQDASAPTPAARSRGGSKPRQRTKARSSTKRQRSGRRH